MRLLVLPFVSDPVGRDPYYANLLGVVDGFAAAKKRVWFEILLPREGYVVDVPLEGPNYKVHLCEYGPNRLIEEMCPDKEMYRFLNVRTTQVAYDAVLNQRTAFGPLLKKIVKPKTRGIFHVDVPVFHMFSEVKTPALVSGLSELYGDDEMLLDLLCAFSDYAIVANQSEFDELKQVARLYLKASKIEEMGKRVCVTWFSGLDLKKIEQLAVGPRDEKLILYGGRWNEMGKNISAVLNVFELLSRSGEYRFRFTSPSNEQDRLSELRQRHPFVEFIDEFSREMHLKNVGECGVFVNCSKYEAFCLTAAEMLLGGMVGVFLRQPWVERIYPKYPFVGETTEELAGWVRVICKDFERAVEQISPWVDALREQEDDVSRFDVLYDFMNARVIAAGGDGYGGDLRDLIAEALNAEREPVAEQSLYARMQAMSRTGRVFGKKGDRMTKLYLRQLIRKCGYDDLCDSAEVRFGKM